MEDTNKIYQCPVCNITILDGDTNTVTRNTYNDLASLNHLKFPGDELHEHCFKYQIEHEIREAIFEVFPSLREDFYNYSLDRLSSSIYSVEGLENHHDLNTLIIVRLACIKMKKEKIQ